LLKRYQLSPGAIRARRSRQRLKKGRRVFRIELDERRLRLALQLAERLDEGEQVEAVIVELVGDFIAAWLGEAKK
jgi:hypothetical protein